MKKSLLILMLTAFITIPAFAELTVDDTTSPEYLKNNGYSSAFAITVNKSKAQANGEPLTEAIEKEEYNQPFVKFVRRLFMYIDPSLDDHTFMNDHDIHTSPSIDDL